MKQKKLLAIVLSVVMIISMIPSVALADVSDIKCEMVLQESTQGTAPGVLVDFKCQTGNIKIWAANIVFTYDTSIFQLVNSSGEPLTLPTTSPIKLPEAQLSSIDDFTFENFILARENTDGTAQVAFLRTNLNPEDESKAFGTLTSFGTCFLAYKAGKDRGDVTTQSLRLATVDEAGRVAQSDVVYVADEGYVEYEYGSNTGNDTLDLESNITFGKEFGFAQAPTCNAPTGVTAEYGQKLKDITLSNPSGNTPGTWSWMNGGESVGEASETPKTFKAKFTPDSSDYATIENIDVSVTVNRARIIVKANSFDIYVNGKLPDLTAPALGTHYTVTGLVGSDKLGGTVSMKYCKNGEEVAVNLKTPGTYDIVISGATEPAGENYYQPEFVKGTLTIAKQPSGGGGGGGGGGGAAPAQKPNISTDSGASYSLDITGTTAKFTALNGYAISDVTLNGVSKGAVTSLSGLKTGDKVVVTTTKVNEEDPTKPTDPTVPKTDAERVDAVKKIKWVARSAKAVSPKGKKCIKLWYYDKYGSKLVFDGVEIWRSTKRYSGYGKKPLYVTTKNVYYNTSVKPGKYYYYKVRGFVVTADGGKHYTDWSLKAYRQAPR